MQQEAAVTPNKGCELELTAPDERLRIPITHSSAIQHTQVFQFVRKTHFDLDSLERGLGQFVNHELIGLVLVIPNCSAEF